jgi:hypothetical protein
LNTICFGKILTFHIVVDPQCSGIMKVVILLVLQHPAGVCSLPSVIWRPGSLRLSRASDLADQPPVSAEGKASKS